MQWGIPLDYEYIGPTAYRPQNMAILLPTIGSTTLCDGPPMLFDECHTQAHPKGGAWILPWFSVYDTRLYDNLDITTHFCATKFFSSKLPLLYDYNT